MPAFTPWTDYKELYEAWRDGFLVSGPCRQLKLPPSVLGCFGGDGGGGHSWKSRKARRVLAGVLHLCPAVPGALQQLLAT